MKKSIGVFIALSAVMPQVNAMERFEYQFYNYLKNFNERWRASIKLRKIQ